MCGRRGSGARRIRASRSARRTARRRRSSSRARSGVAEEYSSISVERLRLLRHDEQAPEESLARRAGDADVKRPLELDPFRNAGRDRPFCQQAALCAVNLSSAPTRVPSSSWSLVQKRELDPRRRRVDLDPTFADGCKAGDVDLEQVATRHGPVGVMLSRSEARTSRGRSPRRSVKRHASCVVSGSGSAW